MLTIPCELILVNHELPYPDRRPPFVSIWQQFCGRVAWIEGSPALDKLMFDRKDYRQLNPLNPLTIKGERN